MSYHNCRMCGEQRVEGQLNKENVLYCPNGDCSDHELYPYHNQAKSNRTQQVKQYTFR